ncbi:MAG TPA: hypothetical protein VEG64_12160 [Candidatus Sulfotelmatobacter sp.]|nr:hypothetical protein [Candidatus Sulfotelmatobacter sp.]
MESLERFAQNQRIIEDYASQWLADIPSDLGRLLHVSMLRNMSTGRYHHPLLEEMYSEPGVHQALLYCHEELFEKVLEASLEQQEWDLRSYFVGLDSSPAEASARWLESEFFRLFVPLGTPPYLRDLFFSNMRIVLRLIVAERASITAA